MTLVTKHDLLRLPLAAILEEGRAGISLGTRPYHCWQAGRTPRKSALPPHDDGGTPQGALLRHPLLIQSQRPRSGAGWTMWPTWSPPHHGSLPLAAGQRRLVYHVVRLPSLCRQDGEHTGWWQLPATRPHAPRRCPRGAVGATKVSTENRTLSLTSSAGWMCIEPPVRRE